MRVGNAAIIFKNREDAKCCACACVCMGRACARAHQRDIIIPEIKPNIAALRGKYCSLANSKRFATGVAEIRRVHG